MSAGSDAFVAALIPVVKTHGVKEFLIGFVLADGTSAAVCTTGAPTHEALREAILNRIGAVAPDDTSWE